MMKGNAMKLIPISLAVVTLVSMNVWAESFVSEEEHLSPEACREAIVQYAKDTETWKKHAGESIKVTWKSRDSVKLEHPGMTEELTCKGKVSQNKITSQ
jgi:Cu/Ag efflux protein CusF